MKTGNADQPIHQSRKPIVTSNVHFAKAIIECTWLDWAMRRSSLLRSAARSVISSAGIAAPKNGKGTKGQEGKTSNIAFWLMRRILIQLKAVGFLLSEYSDLWIKGSCTPLGFIHPVSPFATCELSGLLEFITDHYYRIPQYEHYRRLKISIWDMKTLELLLLCLR